MRNGFLKVVGIFVSFSGAQQIGSRQVGDDFDQPFGIDDGSLRLVGIDMPLDWSDDGLPQQEELHQSAGGDAGNGAAAPAPMQQPPRVETIAPQVLFDQLVVRETVLVSQIARKGRRAGEKKVLFLKLDVDDYKRTKKTLGEFSVLSSGTRFRAAFSDEPSNIAGILHVKIEQHNVEEDGHFLVVEKEHQMGDKRNPRTRKADEKRAEKRAHRGQMLCEEWDRVKAAGPGNEAELEHEWQRDMRLVRRLELLLPEADRTLGDEASSPDVRWWTGFEGKAQKTELRARLAAGCDQNMSVVYAVPFYHNEHDRIFWYCRTLCQVTQKLLKIHPQRLERILKPAKLLELVEAKRVILRCALDPSDAHTLS